MGPLSRWHSQSLRDQAKIKFLCWGCQYFLCSIPKTFLSPHHSVYSRIPLISTSLAFKDLASLLKTPLFSSRFFSVLKPGGTLALFLFLTIQCSWTPEIETLIHQSPKGRVALETSKLFTVLPNHPHTFTESLLKNILKGFSQIQEKGILQELFFSSSTPLPVFSSAQIDFLVPHLAQAISRSTPDELITFQCAGENERHPTRGRDHFDLLTDHYGSDVEKFCESSDQGI